MIDWKRIQIIANTMFGSHRHLIEGIAHYARTVKNWELEICQLYQADGDVQPDKNVAGIIAPHGYSGDRWLSDIQALPCHLVLYGRESHAPARRSLSQFYPDETMIGKFAAEHFLEKGFRQFAYVGNDTWPCSEERGLAFRAHLRENGYDCEWFLYHRASGNRPFIDWINNSSGPKGAFCVTDISSNLVLGMIRKAGIECPLDLAILGVDNDELLCNMSSPPMSSIDTNWQGMGYAAAEQLDALISGRSTRVVHRSWKPKGVVERKSTDFLGIDDDIVVKALLYIQRHIKTQITVSSVMSAVGVCRPTLDDHFKKTLNRTAAQEINRLRLEKARQLLTNTTMTIEAIALDCGFLNPDRLYRIFQRQLNTTPGKYRTMHTKRYLN